MGEVIYLSIYLSRYSPSITNPQAVAFHDNTISQIALNLWE